MEFYIYDNISNVKVFDKKKNVKYIFVNMIDATNFLK